MSYFKETPLKSKTIQRFGGDIVFYELSALDRILYLEHNLRLSDEDDAPPEKAKEGEDIKRLIAENLKFAKSNLGLKHYLISLSLKPGAQQQGISFDELQGEVAGLPDDCIDEFYEIAAQLSDLITEEGEAKKSEGESSESSSQESSSSQT